jgi:hypothetical protein
VAEIRPIASVEEDSLEARIKRLEEAGVVLRGERRRSFGPVARRPGALERFLAERGE